MQLNLARLLVLSALLPAAGIRAVVAQETENESQAAEIDALEPAISSEALNEAATEAAQPTAVLAQDVRRRTVTNGVMDEMDLGRTEITGNQELPTVLYIVPWKKSDPGDLMGKPVNTLLDEVLAPIDRTEFIRQVDYYEDLYGKEEE
jgi:hypothetical protein